MGCRERFEDWTTSHTYLRHIELFLVKKHQRWSGRDSLSCSSLMLLAKCGFKTKEGDRI